MGVAGDLLLSLAGVLVVLAAPLEVAFGALVVFWLLVPGNLIVPHAPHLVLVDQLVLYAFALRLILRRRPGEPTGAAYALTPVHGALGALLLAGFLDGVAFAPRNVSVASDLHAWLNLLALAVLFVVVLAVVRSIGARRAITIIVSVLAVAVLIGLAERLFFHSGWSNFFFERLPASYLAPGAGPLELRGPHVRSQVAAQFAEEYGWVLAMLLPIAIFAVMRWARLPKRWARVPLVLPLLVIIAVIFSASRGAELAAVAVALLLVLFAGLDRRVAAWGIFAVAAGALMAIADPSFITSPFTNGVNDPASIRLDRLPLLFSLVVHRPFTGLGFNGVASAFTSLDNGYALAYATLGVVGVLAWLTFMVTALATTARALRAPRGSDARTLGVACLIGILAAAVAAANYSAVGTPESTWALVVLAAIGVHVAETVPRAIRPKRRWLPRMLLPMGGAGLGLALLVATPTSTSESLSVFTVAPWVLAEEGPVIPATSKGNELVDTLCPTVTSPDTIAPDTSVSCLQESQVFPEDYQGLALVSVRGPTPTSVRREVIQAFTPIQHNMNFEVGTTGTIQAGKPAWATTAPVSGAVAGLLAMFFVPPLNLRRRRANGGRYGSKQLGASSGADRQG